MFSKRTYPYVIAATVVLVGLGWWASGRYQQSEPIKVGILHSLTGPMAISERAMADAELLAIEEINASGGIHGRMIEPVVRRRTVRLANVRRRGGETHHGTRGGHGFRVLDFGQPQDRASDIRKARPPAGLPHGVRGSRSFAEHYLHRCGAQSTNPAGPEVGSG